MGHISNVFSPTDFMLGTKVQLNMALLMAPVTVNLNSKGSNSITFIFSFFCDSIWMLSSFFSDISNQDDDDSDDLFSNISPDKQPIEENDSNDVPTISLHELLIFGNSIPENRSLKGNRTFKDENLIENEEEDEDIEVDKDIEVNSIRTSVVSKASSKASVASTASNKAS